MCCVVCHLASFIRVRNPKIPSDASFDHTRFSARGSEICKPAVNSHLQNWHPSSSSGCSFGLQTVALFQTSILGMIPEKQAGQAFNTRPPAGGAESWAGQSFRDMKKYIHFIDSRKPHLYANIEFHLIFRRTQSLVLGKTFIHWAGMPVYRDMDKRPLVDSPGISEWSRNALQWHASLIISPIFRHSCSSQRALT